MTDQTNEKPEVITVLLNGNCIPNDFYNKVKLQIKDRLPSLNHGPSFTAKNLCGKDFWSSLTVVERRWAGKCVLDLVKHGELPLIPVKHAHEYPKKYKLK